jgi:cell division control protein 6
MSQTNAINLFREFASMLGISIYGLSERELLKAIEKKTSGTKGEMIVVILDEIDALETKFQRSLQATFELPAAKDSRLVLIGVANALDLTSRVLPQLVWLQPACRPVLLHFRPYTKFQLAQIINGRLSEIDDQDSCKVLPALCVQYVAGKISNLCGDARRALDVCRSAVEKKRAETTRQRVIDMSRRTSPRKQFNSPQKQVMVAPQPVSLPQVAQVFAESMSMSIVGNSAVGFENGSNKPDGDSGLPILQKLALLALWAVLSCDEKKSDIAMTKFYTVFRKVCVKTGSASNVVSKGEFMSLCGLLEAKGMMEVQDGTGCKTPAVFRSPRCSTISFRANIKQLEDELRADSSSKIFLPVFDDPKAVL